MWTLERQQEFRLCEGAAEMQSRMHTDLVALEGLSNQLAALMGARIIVEKGYAVDALCRSRLTRLHYDVDTLLATPWTSENPRHTYDIVTEVLERSTGFAWEVFEWDQNSPQWVKFCEKGRRRWHEKETGANRDTELAHAIDMHIVHSSEPFADPQCVELRNRSGKTYLKPVTQANLYDTFGQNFHLTVPTLNQVLATKIHMTHSFARQLRDSDFTDFKMLFADPRFDPASFSSLAEGYYRKNPMHNKRDAAEIVASELGWLSNFIALPDELQPYLTRAH